MLVKRLKDCREIRAGDRTRLRELLHPDRDPIDIRYSLAVAFLEPGQSSTRHILDHSEVYYIIRGSGTMHVGDEARRVEPGDAVYIPPGDVQWLDSDTDEAIEFACIVDPAWTPDGERTAG